MYAYIISVTFIPSFLLVSFILLIWFLFEASVTYHLPVTYQELQLVRTFFATTLPV